jgi:shikimate dehydrogenase
MSRPHRFALLGQSITYSKSPDIFAAISRFTGQPIEFDLLSLDPPAFEPAVRQIAQGTHDGFALTIPFKEQILPLLDTIDPLARQVRAVNCVSTSNGKLTGHNTDFHGFLVGLESVRSRLKTGPALVLGTGGAARTVLCALCSLPEVATIVVAGRSEHNLGNLPTELARFRDMRFVPLAQLASLSEYEFQLVVNCTPLGGPNDPATLPFPMDFHFLPGSVYYDLSYNSANRTLARARDGGAYPINGSAMLVAQALRSFHIWSGIEVPFEPIYSEVFGSAPYA